MSKASSVINAAASGIRSRSFHPYFSEVNPIGSQHIDKLTQARETWKFIDTQRKYINARILKTVTKY